MFLRAIALIGVMGVLWGVSPVSSDAQGRTSKRDAQVMKQKLEAVAARASRASGEPRRTTVTEGELNSFLAYELGQDLPKGLVDPSIAILGTGRVSGSALVDLDAVRKAGNSTGLLDPRSYLTGQLPVTATGVLRTHDGVGRFELESTSIGGVPIPKLFLQEIVAYYSKTPDMPDGVSLDGAFELPAHIREIQVERGHAIIVQ